MGMAFYWLILGTLAVWRITHFLAVEAGPWDVIVRLRNFLGAGFWGSLFACFYCLSLWVAAPVACLVGSGWKEKMLLWLALSAGAIVLERITLGEDETLPAPYTEYADQEQTDKQEEEQHVLRQR
jgi:hypothetical protein